MGLRGPGSKRRVEAIAAGKGRRARGMPWEKKGLSRPEKVIAFLEYLPVTKGILAGQKMKLLPDQLEFVRQVYGRKKADGRREVSLAIKSAPKGQGKSGFAAGTALCHMLGPEAEPRGEVYSASIDKTHAAKLYAEIEAIIFAVPEFAARTNCTKFHKIIHVLGGVGNGSTYEALSADARKAQGLAPSLWIYDELAQVDDRELLDNLLEGMGKRKEALGLIISTQARNDSHALSVLIDEALKERDPSMYCHLIAVPPEADIFDVEVLKKANPAWGHYLDVDDLLKSLNRARTLPMFEDAFRNLRGNQRIDSANKHRIVTPAVWRLGAVPLKISDGARCFGGLDLSGRHDLTALVLAFDDPEGGFDLLPFFWTPLDQMLLRAAREQEQFRKWMEKGYLIGIPGPVIEFRLVAAQIAAIGKRYNIEAIGYDRWRIHDLKHELAKIKCPIPLEPFGQGYVDMSPAVENFADLALTGRLRHDGHPVLTACVANAILSKADDAGNQKFQKGKSNEAAPVRIDGVIAAAMALGTANRKIVAPDRKPAYQMLFVG